MFSSNVMVTLHLYAEQKGSVSMDKESDMF